MRELGLPDEYAVSRKREHWVSSLGRRAAAVFRKPRRPDARLALPTTYPVIYSTEVSSTQFHQRCKSIGIRRVSRTSPRQATVTQLTANPVDLPVTSARISPDGKYLAYADPTGIQVRVIDTGETQRIADTRGMEVYAWSGDGTKIRAAACDTATCTGWDLSLVGSTRRRSGAVWPVTDAMIWPWTDAVQFTAEGSRLLRVTQGSRELWVDPVDGSAPRHLVDLGPNGSASWSADGERVLFTRGDTAAAVQSMPLAGGSRNVNGGDDASSEPPRHSVTGSTFGARVRKHRRATLGDSLDDPVRQLPKLRLRSGRARIQAGGCRS
jgi:hypothetical protein